MSLLILYIIFIQRSVVLSIYNFVFFLSKFCIKLILHYFFSLFLRSEFVEDKGNYDVKSFINKIKKKIEWNWYYNAHQCDKVKWLKIEIFFVFSNEKLKKENNVIRLWNGPEIHKSLWFMCECELIVYCFIRYF